MGTRWMWLLALTACSNGALDTADPDGDGLKGGMDCDNQDADVGGSTWWLDVDGDGYGDEREPITHCSEPMGYAAVAGDCDDHDDAVHPDADERCDGIDNDCDELVDDADDDVASSGMAPWSTDGDGDGFGDADGAATVACEAPAEDMGPATDCDDDNPSVYPGREELCDGIDSDCDATTFETATVSFESDDGAWTSLTALFEDGSTAHPAVWSPDEPGALHFCRGTHYVQLHLDEDVEVYGDEAVLEARSWRLADVEDATVGFNDVSLVSSFSGDGACVRVDQGSLTLSGVSLECASDGDGGAVWALLSTITLEEVAEATSSARNGGLVYSLGSDVRIEASTISGSTASDAGGVLYASGGDVSLSEVTLSGSRADEGGALWLDAPGLAELTDVTLEDNIADGDGGAVWQRNGSLTVSGGSASTNEAGGSGGAFFLDEVEADFTSWSTSTNSALTGGAVHAEGAMLTLDTVAFSSDSAISSGGAIYLDDADASFTDTSFTGHSAPVAGAVEMRAGSLTLSGLEASNNTASTGHGGFLKSSNGATLEIDNATFSDNAADSGGGDVSVASSTLMLSESTSSGASGETGAAVQLSYADAVFDEVTLSDCQYPKGKFDGCVALLDSDASMTALTLEDVAGAGKGAGLYASDSTLDIAGSTFSALSADNGGAIYQDDGVLTLTDTSFESCSADGWGGALHLSDATATMSEVVLDANEATDNGGAIYGSGTTLVLDSVQVTDNQASGEGGGLLLNELTTLAWTSEGTLASQLSGNTAESGGGLYAESIEFVSLEDLEVSDNTATSGGGLYIVQTDTLLQDVSFEDNTADAGGAIGLVLGAPLEVVGFNTTFSDNADDDIAYVQSGESYDDADEDLSSFVCDHERCE